MQNQEITAENSESRYIKNYMEKIFYFCLKKTGNRFEAEDLTSDISFNIISQLRKGVIPMNFSAWIWKIARNRYSLWANNKNKENRMIYNGEIFDVEAESDMSVENEFISKEDYEILKRELAFISSDYRKIIVAFYIEDKKIQEISHLLGLSEGTVKSKLFRARKILKEGMNMAREFGAMSYKPENIDFIMNGIPGKNGEPFSLTEHVLCKNILLAAYKTPSTAEELSIELGVALPYMEDELNHLVNADLLKKNGRKYETNIFIVSAAARKKIYDNLYKIIPDFTKAIIDFQEFIIKCYDESGFQWHEGYQSYEDMKWALLMLMVDNINFEILKEVNEKEGYFQADNIGTMGHTKRPNGGEWDLLGLEEYKGEQPAGVGLHSCIDRPQYKKYINFGQFKFNYKDIRYKTPVHISYEEAEALIATAKSDVSKISEEILENLVSYGYLEKTENRYKPTFYVRFINKVKNLPEKYWAEYEILQEKAKGIGLRHYYFCRDVIYQEIPEFLKEDKHQIAHACANVYAMRGGVLEEALKTGYISYSEEDDRKMLGAYLFID